MKQLNIIMQFSNQPQSLPVMVINIVLIIFLLQTLNFNFTLHISAWCVIVNVYT